MSTTTALHTRLKELSAALGQIHPLVNRLRNFTTSVGQGDEARLELGTEIHGMLKAAEEQMELLRVEVEALESGMENKRKGLGSEKEEERERVVVLAGRLVEDLRRYVLSMCRFWLLGSCANGYAFGLTGREAIFGILNYKRRKMRNLRNGRRGSCYSPDRRVLSRASSRRRN